MKSINNWFPSEADMDQNFVAYNPETDEIEVKYKHYRDHTSPVFSTDFIIVLKGDINYLKIMKEIARRKESAKKQTKRKEFIDSVTNNLKLKSANETLKFLHGATEQTRNQGLFILDDYLIYNNIIVLKRIDPDNFLLGAYLSNFSGWNVPIAHKILPVVASSDQNFWKSAICYRNDNHPPEVYILGHISSLIAYCYVKWPWARKADKAVYAYQMEEAKNALVRANIHFGKQFDLGSMHITMMNTFGNRKVMIEQIEAFRVVHELSS